MIRIILSGLIVVIGVNVLLAMRDSVMWDQIERRNQQIEQLLDS